MAAEHGAPKRTREEDTEIDSSEEKKLRCDDLLDESDPDPTIEDLESVLKSLDDEEIWSSTGSGFVPQPELGYLLEASDDELGLPPYTAAEEGASEFLGLGENWGFEEETGFGAAEFGFVDGGGGGGDYLALDGLFDYSDAGFGSTEFSWRSESMPAQ